MSEQIPIGPHLLELCEPDIFIIRPKGRVLEADIHAFFDTFEQFAKNKSHVYQLIDVSEIGEVTPEARKVAGNRQLPPAYAGLVIFGGTFQQQLIANLVTKAGWLLRGRALGKPMPHSEPNEKAAKTWIESRRKHHHHHP